MKRKMQEVGEWRRAWDEKGDEWVRQEWVQDERASGTKKGCKGKLIAAGKRTAVEHRKKKGKKGKKGKQYYQTIINLHEDNLHYFETNEIEISRENR